HFLVGARDALPRSMRRRAGLRVELGAGGPGLARVTLGEGVSTELRAPDPGRLSTREDGAIRVGRLGAAAGSDLATLVDAARAAAGELGASRDARVWRPRPGGPPPEPEPDALEAVAAAGRTRVALRLTIESPPQPARDVEVELGLDRTFADMAAALT